jgi:trimethylamine--corrinoid protein Co-methyltransferase
MIPENDCAVIVGAARQGIPIFLMGGPMAGATGPVTLAGNVVQLNAEMLACIVLAKATNPQVPLIYGPVAKTFDMHVGNLVTAGPEAVLEQLAGVQLGKFYQLPVGGSGIICDAKAPDAQMGWECMATSLLAAEAGMNLIVGAASIDAEFILSLEALAIHHEVAAFVSRIIRGMNTDDDSLGVEAIMATGPAGEFLSADHTLNHFRDEFWVPSLSLRASYSSWEAQGSRSLRDHAKDFVRQKLSSGTTPPVPEDIEKELSAIVEELGKGK